METLSNKITIRDIARLAGVSIGTVDRVIHERGEVSQKTREKILKITSTFNFRPDILASALASKKNSRFSILIPAADKESTFWKIPNAGINKAFDEISHYGVTFSRFFFDISNKTSFKTEAQKAIDENPDGILIAPSFQDEAIEMANICKEKKIPFVFFNSSPGNCGQMCFIGQDAKQSGKVAAKLMDYGLVEDSEVLVVSILGLLKSSNHIFLRKQGFLEYFKDKKQKNVNLQYLDIDTLNLSGLDASLRDIFAKNQGIKGIFVTNSRVYHLARFFESESITNINLIGYDLTPENIHYLEKGTISFLINQKPVEQGYRAVFSLFNKIVLKKDVPSEILLPIDIVTKENLKYYEEY